MSLDLVKLTALDGSAIYFNPQSVNVVRLTVPGEAPSGRTAIVIEGVTFYVKEVIDEALYRLR